MTAPNNQPAPEGFLGLSSKWLIDNPLPEDALAFNNGMWHGSACRGMVVPHPELYPYATARTDLPREAYADDEIRPMTAEERKALDEFTMAELRIEPGAEVASERAEETEIQQVRRLARECIESMICFNREADRIHCALVEGRFVERDKELATLRAQLEAKNERIHFLEAENRGLNTSVNLAEEDRFKVRHELDAKEKAKIDADDLEFQIAADLESALIDGEIAPEKYVEENRKTIRQLIDRAIARALTPSQQPDNLDSSGGIGRRTSNEADRLARADDSMGVQVPPAVTPSRPEPPSGYRLKSEGETIIKDDLYFMADRWIPVGPSVGEKIHPSSVGCYATPTVTSRPEPVKAGALTGCRFESIAALRAAHEGHACEKRCPKCGSTLLRNQLGDEWCSFVECDFGIEPAPPIAPEGKATEGEG